MTLAAPGWLALLLLAAPILLLHMRRRRRARVASLLLWELAAGSQAPRRGFGRVPPSTALLLQLLAVVLAALVLARPVPAGAAQHLLLLLDGGWQQNDAQRLAAGVALARRELAAHPGATWSLIWVGGQPRPLAARWSAARTGLADVTNALVAEDAEADWVAAALTTQRLLGEGERTRLVLVGAGPEQVAEVLEQVGAEQEPFLQVAVHALPAATNVRFGYARLQPGGYLSGSLVAVDPGIERATVLVSYQADAPDAGGGALLQGQLEVELQGGAMGEFGAQLDLTAGGVLRLSLLDQPGAPPVTLLVADQAPSARVLYLGAGNQPLLRALQAVGSVEITQAQPGPRPDWSRWDLVILDGVALPEPPTTSTVYLEAAPVVAAPGAVTGWDHEAQLSAQVDWAALKPGASWATPLLPGASALVSGSGGPLIQARRLPHGLEVRLAFDLAASDWLHEPGFLRFVHNLLGQLRPGASTSCVVGLRCALPAGVVGLTDPQGAVVPLARFLHATTETIASSFVPRQAGVHTYTDFFGRPGRLAVNALYVTPGRVAGAASGFDVNSAPLPLDLRLLLLGLLLAVLVAEAWFGRRTFRRNGYIWSAVAARVALLSLVVLAATDLRLPLPARDGRLVVLAPQGLIAAGDQALPGVTLLPLDAPATALALNLEALLELGAAYLPPAVPGRLLVAGDGAQTQGDYAAAAARLPVGVSLDALPVTRAPEGEVLLRQLQAPSQVLAGDRFQLSAELYAERAARATLLLSRDGESVLELPLELTAGRQRVQVALPAPEVEPGEVLYEARLVGAPEGTLTENDRAAAWVRVLPAPRLLLVADEPIWSGAFAAALSAQGLDVTLSAPGAFPTELDDLLAWQAVILLNVPAVSVPSSAQLLLEQAVRDHGLPLLLLGGDRAFGPGGYLETPLDRLSPTSSLVARQTPELAIAFVLDRSNSMRQYAGDQVRLDIAKVAALQAFELLPEGAQAALIVFDSVARTLVPLGPAAPGDAFRQAIGELEPRGGTAVYPALVEALQQLEGHGASASHVIVMSDGLSQPGDFPGVLAQLRQAGVTVSTIGIGPEADAGQLRDIAMLGGGSFHFSTDFGALPGIMAHEVLLRTGELEAEATSAPAWHDADAALVSAWPRELPAVQGFVPTTLKDDARLHLSVTDEEGQEMPLLASWRYGAGQVVALSTHAAGPWSADWLALPEFPSMWAHLVRQAATARPEQRLELQAALRGNRLTVAVSGASGPQPSLALAGPAGVQRLQLGHRGGGVLGATALLLQPGDYLLSVTDGDQQAQQLLAVAYPAPLDFGLAQPERLAAIALARGGSVVASAALTAPSADWLWPRSRAWPALLVGALALLLLELLLRYPLGLPRRRRKE